MRKAQLAAADEKIAEQGEHIANTEAALETMTAHRDVLHGENEGRKATIGEQEQKIEELSAALAAERVDRLHGNPHDRGRLVRQWQERRDARVAGERGGAVDGSREP